MTRMERMKLTADLGKLGEFVPLSRFNPRWAAFFCHTRLTFGLPTELVIHEAGVYVPKMARVFDTYRHVHQGHIVDYEWLREHAEMLGEVFTGCYETPACYLTEVWADDGDDGHTSYRHEGYRLISVKDLEDVDTYRKVPRCILLGQEDTRYE